MRCPVLGFIGSAKNHQTKKSLSFNLSLSLSRFFSRQSLCSAIPMHEWWTRLCFLPGAFYCLSLSLQVFVPAKAMSPVQYAAYISPANLYCLVHPAIIYNCSGDIVSLRKAPGCIRRGIWAYDVCTVCAESVCSVYYVYIKQHTNMCLLAKWCCI